MKNFERYFIIKVMSELFAYEIYYIYKTDKNDINNLEYIYNVLSSHLIFNPYKNEIMELGKLIAKVVYQIPIQ